MREAELYPALKDFLQRQGYEVKAEIGPCDILARRGTEEPLVVEMKTGLTLELVLQGVARQAMFDLVYLAVPAPRRRWSARYGEMIALLRRLGLGLLVVRDRQVEPHLDPGPYQPRKSAPRAARLLREFDRRQGDPNVGGTSGITRMTAYRQDALRCLVALCPGPAKGAEIARRAGVARATTLMRDNHYGWFQRLGPGLYGLAAAGRLALKENAPALGALGLEGGADHAPADPPGTPAPPA